jgi:hypothetical protein
MKHLLPMQPQLAPVLSMRSSHWIHQRSQERCSYQLPISSQRWPHLHKAYSIWCTWRNQGHPEAMPFSSLGEKASSKEKLV